MSELELVVERCAGIDVHQAQLRVCVRVPGTRRGRAEEFATFGTTTPDLLELSGWLSERGVTHVAMEGTGVYWKPVYYVLEADFDTDRVDVWERPARSKKGYMQAKYRRIRSRPVAATSERSSPSRTHSWK